jgi:DNA repair protein RadA/Sms
VATCTYCFGELDKAKAQCPHCYLLNRVDGSGANTIGKTVRLSRVKNTVSDQRIATGPWDGVLGGGLVITSVVLIGAEPGSGKSTIALQIGHAIGRALARDVLYIAAEQDVGEVREMGDRLGLSVRGDDSDDSPIVLLPCLGDFEGLAQFDNILDEMKPAAVVLDSLPGLVGADHAVAVLLAKTLKKYASKIRAPFLIIDHVTKGDDFAGLKALQHEVDVLLTMRVLTDGTCNCGHESHEHKHGLMECEECGEGECNGYSGPRVLACEQKNRFGPVPAAITLDMTARGLREQIL